LFFVQLRIAGEKCGRIAASFMRKTPPMLNGRRLA